MAIGATGRFTEAFGNNKMTACYPGVLFNWKKLIMGTAPGPTLNVVGAYLAMAYLLPLSNITIDKPCKVLFLFRANPVKNHANLSTITKRGT